MKLRNILFAILVFLLGIKGVSAESNCNGADYQKLQSIYKDLSALSYYELIYNNYKSDQENLATFEADKSMRNLYDCDDDSNNNNNNTCSELVTLVNLYNAEHQRKGGFKNYTFYNTLIAGYNTDCTELTNLSTDIQSNVDNNPKARNTIDYLWSQVDSLIYRVLSNYDIKINGSKIDSEQYESYKEAIAVSYEDFCDYLNSHKSISEFIELALNVVTYAALALGIFLGVLDFIKAIASQEDAALTKAFQSFMKRVAAIALIFLSGVIVTIIINIVAINGVNRDTAICEQFNLSK